MIALLLALALVPSNREYVKEVEAIVSADMKRMQVFQADQAISQEARSVGTNLIMIDSYLVLNELRKLPRYTTREKVDKLVAQLSRDMESLPAL